MNRCNSHQHYASIIECRVPNSHWRKCGNFITGKITYIGTRWMHRFQSRFCSVEYLWCQQLDSCWCAMWSTKDQQLSSKILSLSLLVVLWSRWWCQMLVKGENMSNCMLSAVTPKDVIYRLLGLCLCHQNVSLSAKGLRVGHSGNSLWAYVGDYQVSQVYY